MNAPLSHPLPHPTQAGVRHGSVLELIGNTPVVLAEKLSPPGREVYVKIESANPMGSVKDRLALGLIEAAERDGSLKPGQTVIEATSGNTGIGLALVCARKGYPLVIVMAESFSVERRKILRFLGAKVVLTPASLKGTGMLAKAKELADEHGWFLPRQFENENNAAFHEATTGREIVEAFADAPLHAFVSGLGTGGTISGVGRALKKGSPQTRVVACEPDNSPVIKSGVKQDYAPDGSPASSHPRFRPHPMQGWAPDFIPAVANAALEDGVIDEVRLVGGSDAITWSKRLAREEGVFCGITAGATFACAHKLASELPEGSRVLAMIPDTGERYMTTPLFDGIDEDMDEAEMEISRSTPLARFDAPPPAPTPAAPQPAPEPPQASEAALAHLDAIISNPENPIVFFALEWCEFCWSARRLLERMGVEYKTVNLDGPDYADGQWASDVRAALAVRSGGAPTIPQIFIKGDHIGGATDLFDMYNGGELAKLLDKTGIVYQPTDVADAYSLLPKWMQKR
ncbi:pyridoxal-phosphate dependent enzyme [Altererythrobacter sp.]|uniref:pyridoxal-phosphate dependent enzyme n=1 Tax=Altererythrobacter sp. TaxID=1872480 RepID=UPI003CFD7480